MLQVRARHEDANEHQPPERISVLLEPSVRVERLEERKERLLKGLEDIGSSPRSSGGLRRAGELIGQPKPFVGKSIAEVETQNRVLVEERADPDLVAVRERLDEPGDRVVVRLEGRPGEGMHDLDTKIAPDILGRRGHARGEQQSRHKDDAYPFRALRRDCEHGLEALAHQEVDGRDRADGAVRLWRLNREDRRQKHHEEPAEPGRLRPLPSADKGSAQPDGEQTPFDRIEQWGSGYVVARIVVSTIVEHEQMRGRVLPEYSGPGQMVRGVPDGHGVRALEELLRMTHGKSCEREQEQACRQNRPAEASENGAQLGAEGPPAVASGKTRDGDGHDSGEKVERVVGLQADSDDDAEKQEKETPSGLQGFPEAQNRHDLEEGAEDRDHSEARERHMPAGTRQQDRGGRGHRPGKRPARDQVERRDSQGSEEGREAANRREAFPRDRDGSREKIEEERRHLACARNEDWPIPFQDALSHQVVLNLVEKPARRNVIKSEKTDRPCRHHQSKEKTCLSQREAPLGNAFRRARFPESRRAGEGHERDTQKHGEESHREALFGPTPLAISDGTNTD